jgi:hypothetical protein
MWKVASKSINFFEKSLNLKSTQASLRLLSNWDKNVMFQYNYTKIRAKLKIILILFRNQLNYSIIIIIKPEKVSEIFSKMYFYF